MSDVPFSARYILVDDADVHVLENEEAEMDSLLYNKLAEKVGEPVVGKVGKLHYAFKPAAAFPKGHIIVPKRNHDREPDTLLIQK